MQSMTSLRAREDEADLGTLGPIAHGLQIISLRSMIYNPTNVQGRSNVRFLLVRNDQPLVGNSLDKLLHCDRSCRRLNFAELHKACGRWMWVQSSGNLLLAGSVQQI
jgi:hypothetical protein